MAVRKIGTATVYLEYLDHNGCYKATVAVGKRNCFSAELHAPPAVTPWPASFNDLGFGVGVGADSPLAYDRMAQIAIREACDDEFSNPNAELAGEVVRATEGFVDEKGEYQVRRPGKRERSILNRRRGRLNG